MKRLSLISLLLSILSLVIIRKADAQTDKEGGRFRAGLTFGAVATDIPGTDTRDKDSDFSKLGLSFGGIINTRLNEKNTLQLEINYCMKGAQQQPDSNNQGYFKMALGYIEVPILIRHTLHMNIRRKPMERLELEGGFSGGRLVNAGFTDGMNYPQPITPGSLNSTDFSVLGGLNFNFTPNIYFTLRYSNSLIPVINRNDINPAFVRYTWNNGNNQVILMAIKYVFGKQRTITPKTTTAPPTPTE
jgi:hypothetical protein